MRFYLNIDWQLLHKQKQWLLIQPQSEEADGILGILDTLQDQAVQQGVPEATVFTKTEIELEEEMNRPIEDTP